MGNAGYLIAPYGNAFTHFAATLQDTNRRLGIDVPTSDAISTYFPPIDAKAELGRITSPDRIPVSLLSEIAWAQKWDLATRTSDGRHYDVRPVVDAVMDSTRPENIERDAFPIKTSTPTKFEKGYVPHINKVTSQEQIRIIMEWISERQPEGTQWASRATSKLGLEFIDQIKREGSLDLRGQKFVVLGGSADYAMTRLLLEAGAEVLLIAVEDRLNRYAKLVKEADQYPGRLHYVEGGGTNLLEEPHRIAATVLKFADGDKFHVVDFLYLKQFQVQLATVRFALFTAWWMHVASYTAPRTPTVSTQLPRDIAQLGMENFRKQNPVRQAFNIVSRETKYLNRMLPGVFFNAGIVESGGVAVAVNESTDQNCDYVMAGKQRTKLAEALAAVGMLKPTTDPGADIVWGGHSLTERSPITVVDPVVEIAMTTGLAGNDTIDTCLGWAWTDGAAVFGNVQEARDFVGFISLAGIFGETSPYAARNARAYESAAARLAGMAEIFSDGGLASRGNSAEGLMGRLFMMGKITGAENRRWTTLTHGKENRYMRSKDIT